MHGGHSAATLLARHLEGVLTEARTARPGDDLDRLSHVGMGLKLDARIKVLGVLANDDDIDLFVLEWSLQPGEGLGRADVGEEIERLAKGHVGADVAASGRGGGWSLQGDADAADALDGDLGDGRQALVDSGEAGFVLHVFSVEAAGGKDFEGGPHDLGPDPVAGDDRNSVFWHGCGLPLSTS